MNPRSIHIVGYAQPVGATWRQHIILHPCWIFEQLHYSKTEPRYHYKQTETIFSRSLKLSKVSIIQNGTTEPRNQYNYVFISFLTPFEYLKNFSIEKRNHGTTEPLKRYIDEIFQDLQIVKKVSYIKNGTTESRNQYNHVFIAFLTPFEYLKNFAIEKRNHGTMEPL